LVNLDDVKETWENGNRKDAIRDFGFLSKSAQTVFLGWLYTGERLEGVRVATVLAAAGSEEPSAKKAMKSALESIATGYDHEHHSLGSVRVEECCATQGCHDCRVCLAEKALAQAEDAPDSLDEVLDAYGMVCSSVAEHFGVEGIYYELHDSRDVWWRLDGQELGWWDEEPDEEEREDPMHHAEVYGRGPTFVSKGGFTLMYVYDNGEKMVKVLSDSKRVEVE
jgi:hypothetical protein